MLMAPSLENVFVEYGLKINGHAILDQSERYVRPVSLAAIAAPETRQTEIDYAWRIHRALNRRVYPQPAPVFGRPTIIGTLTSNL
jgi:hypothetical protein